MTCDSRCWTPARCTTCGRPIAPTGRSVALEASDSYCTTPYEHGGATRQHLWSEHDPDRSYFDPDGWAEHLATCPQCQEAEA